MLGLSRKASVHAVLSAVRQLLEASSEPSGGAGSEGQEPSVEGERGDEKVSRSRHHVAEGFSEGEQSGHSGDDVLMPHYVAIVGDLRDLLGAPSIFELVRCIPSETTAVD